MKSPRFPRDELSPLNSYITPVHWAILLPYVSICYTCISFHSQGIFKPFEGSTWVLKIFDYHQSPARCLHTVSSCWLLERGQGVCSSGSPRRGEGYLQGRGGAKMCKGEKGGARKAVEAQGGDFLTRSGVSSGEVENFKKSHVTVS